MPDLDHFNDIQEIVQGIGAVPQFMLAPVAGRHRQEEELIDIGAAYGAAGSFAGGELRPLPPKKPDRFQEIPSSSRRMHRGISYRISG